MSTLVKRAAPLSQLTTMADSRWIHFELLNKLHAKRGIAFFDDSDSIGRMALVDGAPTITVFNRQYIEWKTKSENDCHTVVPRRAESSSIFCAPIPVPILPQGHRRHRSTDARRQVKTWKRERS